MTVTYRTVSDIVGKEAKKFALYTIEARALPNMIDGLKPSQRFFLYSALKNAKDFTKVAAIGGRVSEYGYQHAETACTDAGVLMASPWYNNFPVLDARGNFGSRMVQTAASPRYIYAKAGKNFNLLFKDNELAPVHEDDEHLPPAYYLPVIPFVLLNGVKGIATGFATEILPHSSDSVVKCVKEYLKTGEIKKDPIVAYPQFSGTIDKKADGKYIMEGTYEITGKTKLTITEVPYKFEREVYVAMLDDLEDRDIIVKYNDRCGKENFKFEITLKRDFLTGKESDHDKIMKTFKLRQSISQNITVIDWDSKLREYNKASDLIKDFVDHRLTFVEKRIGREMTKCTDGILYAEAKVEFIEKILSGDIVLSGKKRKEAVDGIKAHVNLSNFADTLISLPMHTITLDEIERLRSDVKALQIDLEYWVQTTPRIEYEKDLKKI